MVQEYYETFAKMIPPGSVRIATTRFSDDVDATAWRRLDGTVALALLNRTEQECAVTVRQDDREAEVTLAPFALEAFLIVL